MADFPDKMLPKYIDNNPYPKHINRFIAICGLHIIMGLTFIWLNDHIFFVAASFVGAGSAGAFAADGFRKYRLWESGESPYQYIARMTDFIRSNTYHE